MPETTSYIDEIIQEAKGQGQLMRHKLYADDAGQCIYLRGGQRGYLKFELWALSGGVIGPYSFLAIAGWAVDGWQKLEDITDADVFRWLAEARLVLETEQ